MKVGVRVLVLLAVGLALVWLWGERDRMIVSAPALPVDFVHADHITENCIACHHNFNDGTGAGECYHCHKTDLSVAHDMQTIFHNFCRDCHLSKSGEGEASGPLRVCDGCHRPNDGFM